MDAASEYAAHDARDDARRENGEDAAGRAVLAELLVTTVAFDAHLLCSRETRAQSPNDPKLSDRGVRRGTCMVGGKAAAEAGAVTHGAVRCSAWLGVAGCC